MKGREIETASGRDNTGRATPESPAQLHQAALDHMRAGRQLDAQLCCQQILTTDPGHADTLHLMGLLSIQAGQFDHAVEWVAGAIRREPKPLYLTTLGTVLLQQGRGADGLKAFQKAAELEPGNAERWQNLGMVLAELQRSDDAILSFQHALELAPGAWDAARKLAILLQQAGRSEEALVALDRCEVLKPGDVQMLSLRANARLSLGRYADALGDLERLRLLDPANADLCNQLGNCLSALGRSEQALSAYDKAFALGDTHALKNKAIALEQLGRFDLAIAGYRRAAAADPDDAGAAWNLALLQLLTGNFEAGWAGREAARWKIPILVAGYPKLSGPLWQGAEPIAGKTILVCPDEGLGDVIQFSRYVPLLAARGARVILLVQDELQPLLARLPGVALCLPKSTTTAPPYDFHCPLTSLPLMFGTRLDTIPAQTCYLPAPPPERVEAWAQRLGAHDRLRVGLVWSGNPRHPRDRARSMPFSALAPLLDAAATFISLQKDPRADDRPALLARTDIIDPTADLTDFVETAALVSCLDLVITVDTSVAHLAAALGRPTWVLLPSVPDYRWLLDRDDSPWYPSMRLFRQDQRRDYAPVIAQVRTELDAMISRGAI
ncbi:putative TPR domain protein [Bradyrhizobium oligotrophicum S58]|uniref:Putative TPR domain protein n=1 Tax=Bradyrhizobium oligotrophicum S58 TaxID=1245469 RepID=M4ZG26_9BRAD|nr:tetratricopeptide repeat-containing glycosyltransferase family protein [Bradyrhizobium oligotrophicum]BAM92763.1 putative TPR domain protein [Bradyrhizobium oligotrophicum S58]